jgi:predicted GNAT superfamily acetyltransferase
MGRMSDSELLSIAPAELSGDALLAKTLLALNNAHAQELSWLEPERLQRLVEQAFLVRRIGDLDAMRSGSPYAALAGGSASTE